MEGQIGPGQGCSYCGMDYGEHSKDCGRSRVLTDTPSTSPPDDRLIYWNVDAGCLTDVCDDYEPYDGEEGSQCRWCGNKGHHHVNIRKATPEEIANGQ